jgi:hypothetical protein
MTLMQLRDTPGVLHFLGEAVLREAEQARRRVADAYHSLEILSAWSSRLARLLSREEHGDLAAALSLLATVSRQHASAAKASGWWAKENPKVIDWDPEIEFRSLDLLEAVDATVEEILNLAQVLLDAHGILSEVQQPAVLRTAGCLLTTAAQVQEVL